MAKLPVPTAKQINQAHQFAQEHAETAIEWVLKCGQLLGERKANLPRGEFDSWVEKNCDFGRSSAYAYMKVAAKSSRGLDDFNSIKQALGYDKPKDKPAPEPLTGAKSEAGVGAEPAPVEAPKPAPVAPQPAPPADEPERPDDHDEDAGIAAAEAELAASIDKVMQSDDKLAAAHAEIKRQAAEIAVLKISRDGYMNGKEAVTKLLLAAQKKIQKLEQKLKAAA